ncbi:class I SAM-dependent methyltransferase [Streptomyces sp. NBC_01724]|uniref:class I SAM-dependent methyltransferase n=1 Tax=Streptomyces sp. NBC_01724 TaxID=2975922 RepID=UPI002E2F454E|nr:class I SAM-dependent methyltransferase [Streptomyces sp. NBC_01724]
MSSPSSATPATWRPRPAVALLLGPLYHLTERDDRLQALAEARRVVKPGGLVAAAGISRFAPLLDYGATTGLVEPEIQDRVRERLATGRYPEPATGLRSGFTVAYYHTSGELIAEATEAGLAKPVVYGIEGPGWTMVRSVERYTGELLGGTPLYAAALAAARLSDDHPALIDASAHMLCVAQA